MRLDSRSWLRIVARSRRAVIRGEALNLSGLRIAYLRWLVAPLVRLAGPGVAAKIASRLGTGVFDLNPPGRERAVRRILSAFGEAKSAERAERAGAIDRNRTALRISRESYQHFARFWVECLFVARRLDTRRWREYVRIESTDEDRLRQISARGCIVAVGYHGNIAAAACALGNLLGGLDVVSDLGGRPELRVWEREIRSLQHVRLIDRRDAAAILPDVLSRRRSVMIVAETERLSGRGPRVRFMGRHFTAHSTIERLCRWFDVPAAVVTCPRGPGAFQFHLRLHEIIEVAACDRDGAFISRVLSELERGMMLAPAQYHWGMPTSDGARLLHSAGSSDRSTGSASVARAAG